MPVTLRTIGIVFATLSLAGAALAQLLPWATVEVEASGVSARTTATTWQLRSHAEGFGLEGDEARGWFDEDWDDEDPEDREGLGKIRWAVPMLAVGSAGILVGLLLGILRQRAVGSVLLGASLLTATGTALFAIGVSDLLEGDQAWRPGFYLAIAGALCGLVAGLLLLRRPAIPQARIPGAP